MRLVLAERKSPRPPRWLLTTTLLVGFCGALATAAAAAPDSVATTITDTSSVAKPPPPPYVMPPLGKGLLDHAHNKLVHFPIVLALGGLVLLALSTRKPELQPVAHAVIWLAAAAAIAAFFSGKFQENRFHGRPKEWLATAHERAATTFTLVCGAWAVWVGLQPSRRLVALILGAIVVAMMAGTGYLGGLLAHGH